MKAHSNHRTGWIFFTFLLGAFAWVLACGSGTQGSGGNAPPQAVATVDSGVDAGLPRHVADSGDLSDAGTPTDAGSPDDGGVVCCFGGPPDGGHADAGVPDAGTPPTIFATITISGFAFSPSTLTAPPGSIIKVINMDSAPHTVTSESASGSYRAGAGSNGVSFDTQDLGRSVSTTFTIPSNAASGTVFWYCNVHKSMMPQGQLTIP